MPELTECRACLPLDCSTLGLFDHYTIDGPFFPFVLDCPPGYNCNNSNSLTLNCCGDTVSVNLVGVTPEERRARINNAIQECIAKLVFCQTVTPGVGPPIVFNFSREVTGHASCPGGGSSSWTIAAGSSADLSPQEATAIAQFLANQLAGQHKCCLTSNLPARACADQLFSATIKATGISVAPSGNSWTISSGALPDGLTLTGSTPLGLISGTPTVPGVFHFTVMVVTPIGDLQTLAVTMSVIGISPTGPALPDATPGDPYSQTFTASAGTIAPLSWQIVAGALPPGITLNEETGELSGTTIVPGDYAFTIRLQDEAT